MLKSIILGAVVSLSDKPITLYKDTAKLCDDVGCVNVLVGENTPTGTFDLVHAKTKESGYGGDVLVFHTDNTGTYAVHRIWTNVKTQYRESRILSDAISDRFITSGCINVDDETYNKLLNYRYIVIKNQGPIQ